MLRDILSRFQKSSFRTRVFLAARCLWIPYQKMAELLPPAGDILDIGCGHGLFSYCLAKAAPARSVLGADHDDDRITQSKYAFREIKNLDLCVGDFSIVNANQYLGIAAMDVLHYFSPERQIEIMKDAFNHLDADGVFVFRDVNIEAGLLSSLARMHEKIMTTCGFTKATALHFQTRAAWTKMAERAGFSVTSRKMSNFPFADIVYICTKLPKSSQ